jgi:iron complex outermembrane receptor protein
VPCAALPCQSNWSFISGSNPNLTPELAKSKTLGLVWSPRWVEGLDLSLDWYQITMTNLISQDAVDSILADCYVANIASRCQGITRNPATHEVTGMFFGEVNLGALRTEGYDFQVNYKLPEFSFGKIAIDWQSSYLSQLDTKADDHPDTPWFGLVGRQSGNAVNGFRVRSNLGVTWE